MCAVDIVFARCRGAGSKRLALRNFLEALAQLADEAGRAFADVCDALSSTGGGAAAPQGAPAPSRGGAAAPGDRPSTMSSLGGTSGGGAAGSCIPSPGGRWGPTVPSATGLAAQAAANGASSSGGSGLTANPLFEGDHSSSRVRRLDECLAACAPSPLRSGTGTAQQGASPPAAAPTGGGPVLDALLARLTALEAAEESRQQQLAALAAQQARLGSQLGRLARLVHDAAGVTPEREGSSGLAPALAQLGGQVAALERKVAGMRAEGGPAGAAAAAAAAKAEAGLVETRLVERQARAESALMQVRQAQRLKHACPGRTAWPRFAAAERPARLDKKMASY